MFCDQYCSTHLERGVNEERHNGDRSTNLERDVNEERLDLHSSKNLELDQSISDNFFGDSNETNCELDNLSESNCHFRDTPEIAISCLDEELCSGASITLREFVICMGVLKSTTHETDTQTAATLKLISLTLPKPNKCPSSIYQLKKYLRSADKTIIKKHFYCSKCNLLSDNDDNDIENDLSFEDENQLEIIESCNCTDKSYFLEIPLIKQLTSLLKRSKFYEKMIKKVDFLNRDDSYYQDVYDGSIYKEFLQTIPSDEIWITFMWYTDGVRIFISSKYNIWGFFLIILELPYTERYKVENMILVALWFGEKKPVPNIFLKFLYSTMKELRKGVNIYVEDLKKNVDLHAAIICGTADLPAKALFLGMNQYNGRFGCQDSIENLL
uniref:Uncharacterized protein n=1 Tax=Trichogramma kaykai TaxID=54128 RepID=A0ABD2XJS3_9HYME